jgi:uncharacterized LabA/DUF88 family protein
MQLLPRPQLNKKLGIDSEQQQEFEQPRVRVIEKPNVSNDHQERVAIFIDGSNLFYAATHLNVEIDYTKLLHCLTKKRKLLRAYFYTAVDSTNKKQQSFLFWMRRNGYRVVTKELIQHPDGSKKANLAVEIAIDMLTLARYCNTLVLLSGEGELIRLVRNINLGEKKMVDVFCQFYHHDRSNQLYS